MRKVDLLTDRNNMTHRRFVNIGGFIDNTAFVEIDKDGNTIVITSAGKRMEAGDLYSLEECLRFVELGWWIEV